MGRLALAQAIAQGFNGHVEADAAAIFEAINDGLGGIVDRHGHALDPGRHAPHLESIAGCAHRFDFEREGSGNPCLVVEANPYRVR